MRSGNWGGRWGHRVQLRARGAVPGGLQRRRPRRPPTATALAKSRGGGGGSGGGGEPRSGGPTGRGSPRVKTGDKTGCKVKTEVYRWAGAAGRWILL